MPDRIRTSRRRCARSLRSLLNQTAQDFPILLVVNQGLEPRTKGFSISLPPSAVHTYARGVGRRPQPRGTTPEALELAQAPLTSVGNVSRRQGPSAESGRP